jgi:radical SAM protein with 4Fe4S-binding SPASM domain
MGKLGVVTDDSLDLLQRVWGFMDKHEPYQRKVARIMAEPSPCDNCWRNSYCSAECSRFKKYTNSGKVISYGNNEHKTLKLLLHH